MKSSLPILIVLGIAYLYLLEDIGNFISSGLEPFKRSLAAAVPT
jgi:hypothetical protein